MADREERSRLQDAINAPDRTVNHHWQGTVTGD